MELNKRERKIDLNKLTPEQADVISAQIGEKVRGICDEAADRVNAILKVYGMSAKIAIAFDHLEQKEEQKAQAPKKRGRKPKKNNLKEEQTS